MAECPEGSRWHKDASKPRGGACLDQAKFLATQARYNATEKGRARRARADKSEKGRARHVRYNATEKGRVTRARFDKSEKGRASQARARVSEKGRARLARFRAKRDADPVRRLHYLNNHAQYYRRQRIAGLEQQLKEL